VGHSRWTVSFKWTVLLNGFVDLVERSRWTVSLDGIGGPSRWTVSLDGLVGRSCWTVSSVWLDGLVGRSLSLDGLQNLVAQTWTVFSFLVGLPRWKVSLDGLVHLVGRSRWTVSLDGLVGRSR
jgi:hypothetical protein